MAQSPEHGLQTELETPAAVPLQASVATDRFPLVGRPVLGARNAATEILALYLGKIPWEVNGDTGEDVTFRLNRVLKNWPVGGEALDYPAASITQPFSVAAAMTILAVARPTGFPYRSSGAPNTR